MRLHFPGCAVHWALLSLLSHHTVESLCDILRCSTIGASQYIEIQPISFFFFLDSARKHFCLLYNGDGGDDDRTLRAHTHTHSQQKKEEYVCYWTHIRLNQVKCPTNINTHTQSEQREVKVLSIQTNSPTFDCSHCQRTDKTTKYLQNLHVKTQFFSFRSVFLFFALFPSSHFFWIYFVPFLFFYFIFFFFWFVHCVRGCAHSNFCCCWCYCSVMQSHKSNIVVSFYIHNMWICLNDENG